MKFALYSLFTLTIGFLCSWIGGERVEERGFESAAVEVGTLDASDQITAPSANVSRDETIGEILEIENDFSRGLALRLKLAGMDGAELRAAFIESSMQAKQLNESVDPNFNQNYHQLKRLNTSMSLIVERWADVDPKSALPIIEELIADLIGSAEMAVLDYETLRELSQSDRGQLVSAFFAAWSRNDPVAAYQQRQVLEAMDPPNSSELVNHLLYAVASQSLGNARAQFNRLKEADVPFNHVLFLQTIDQELQGGVGAAIRFINDNIDYIPAESLHSGGGCFGASLTQSLAERDAVAGYEAWRLLPESRFANHLGRDLINQLVDESDFTKAREILLKLQESSDWGAPVDPFAAPSSMNNISLRYTVATYYRALVARNSSQALSEAYQTADEKARSVALGEIAVTLSDTDYARALDICLNLLKDASYSYLGQVFAKRIEVDLESAVGELMALDPANWSSDNREAIIDEMWTQDPLIAAQFLVDIGNPPTHMYTVGRRLDRLASKGEFEELQMVLNILPPLQLSHHNGVNFIRPWVDADPASAKAYAQQLPYGDTRKEFLHSISNKLVKDDLASAWQMAQDEPDEFFRGKLLEGCLKAIADKNPKEAIQLALEVDGSGPPVYMEQVMNTWMWDQPEAALAYAMSMSDGPVQRSAIVGYLRKESDDIPFEAARQLIDSLANGDEHASAVDIVASQWARSNPEVVANWVNEMGASQARDNAVSALIDSLESYDFEQAFTWSSTLQSDSYRAYKAEQTLSAVYAMDKAQAKALLEGANLTSVEKQKIAANVFNK